MSDLKWTPVKIRLGQIKPWVDNPRMSTKAQAERLIQSERELGQVQTIAIGPADEAGFFPLYDGHQRYAAWYTVKGASYELTALQSNRELTEDERRKMSILLHTASGGWDWNKMASWQVGELKEWGLVNQENVKGWNNDANNVKELLQAEQETADAEPQIDRAAELLEKWQVKTGDLWQIGEHRLICGDCTDAAVVGRVTDNKFVRLVIIDPPYGVSYADKNVFLNAISPANRIETPIENDHNTKEETQALWKAAFAEIYIAMDKGAVIYCFMPQGGDQMMMMMMMMMSEKIEPRHELIWLKNNHVLGRVDYAYKHEPILYAWKEGGHKFYGEFQTSILEYPKPQLSDLHPTMKPVALIEKLISNSSLINESVLDSFSGSGTTLVACQNLSRRGRAIEISPAYCAVTLERMSTAFPELEIKRL